MLSFYRLECYTLYRFYNNIKAGLPLNLEYPANMSIHFILLIMDIGINFSYYVFDSSVPVHYSKCLLQSAFGAPDTY